MSLYETITADQHNARKNRLQSASILTTLLGELQLSLEVVDGKKTINDQSVQTIVAKFVKNNNETLSRNPSAIDLVAENEVLSAYLPKQLSNVELTQIIQTFIRESGQTSVGPIMKFLKDNHQGQYDGKMASEIVKDITK